MLTIMTAEDIEVLEREIAILNGRMSILEKQNIEIIDELKKQQVKK